MKPWIFATLQWPDAAPLAEVAWSPLGQVVNPQRGWLVVRAVGRGRYEGHLHVADYQALLTHTRRVGDGRAEGLVSRGHERMVRKGDMGAPFGFRSVVIELAGWEWGALRRAWLAASG